MVECKYCDKVVMFKKEGIAGPFCGEHMLLFHIAVMRWEVRQVRAQQRADKQ